MSLLLMRLISGLFCLSLCWLAGSLPVFCYGASSAALATVTLRMVRGEQVRLFRDFFAAYRANFRQGTVLGLLGLAALALLGGDLLIMRGVGGLWRTAGTVLFSVMLAVVGFMLTVVFHLQASFDNPIRTTLMNALRFSLGYLSDSFSLLLLLTLLIFSSTQIASMLPLMLVLGTGTFAYVSSLLWERRFRPFLLAAGEL